MLKKIILITYLITGFFLFCENQMIYQLEDFKDLYSDIKILHLSTGKTLLSSSFPMSKSEILRILESFNMEELSSEELIILKRIQTTLEKTNYTNEFNPYINVEFNAETYLQSNNDNDFWMYGYNDRKPIIDLSTGFGINNTFWSRVDIPLQKGMTYDEYSQPQSNLSLLWNLNQIDAQFPFIALSSIGGDNWNISFGRDLLSYGVGETGNFILSSDASYHDYLRLTTFWSKFKYSFTLLNIEAIDLGDDFIPYRIKKDGVITEDRKRIKILIDHNFEFHPTKNLSIALHESTIRGGGEITLPYLNPFMIIHNLALTDKTLDTVLGNSMLSLSFNYTPVRKLNIYGEFALDQLETPSEAERQGENAGKGDPNAFGFLTGVKYLVSSKNSLLFKFEYAYTNPHLYRSDKSWAVYALARYYHNVYNDSNDLVWEPLGHKEGPDAQIIMLSGEGAVFNNKLAIKLEYYNILKGENNIWDKSETGEDAANKTTPSGSDVFTKNIVSLNLNYSLRENLSFYSQLNYLYFTNFRNIAGDNLGTITDFQFIIGGSYKL